MEALAKYWNRAWTWKDETEVIEEFKQAGVEAMLVAFDIESVTGNERAVGDFLFEYLSRLGPVERMPVEGERFNLFASWGEPER